MEDISKLHGSHDVKGMVMSRLAPQAYETKYADFIRLCSEAKARNVDHILVAKPFILGDTYDEITESLSRLAEAGLALRVAGR